MKICPYCGKELVEKALACKYCGEWLSDISEYLEKKGSVYAHADSISIPSNKNVPQKNTGEVKRNSACVFCEATNVLTDDELKEKSYKCKSCGKKNTIYGGRIDDILKNIPVGWGWVLLTVYFAFSIQKYLNTLDDDLQTSITFGLSLIVLLVIYFVMRRFILKERFEKKHFFGNISGVSVISGTVSTICAVIFIFGFHFVYPYTGLQSDKKETNFKVLHYKTKINELSEKQKQIRELLDNPVYDKKESAKKSNMLDEYINLNNDEKKYADSIYSTLSDSEFYTKKNEGKKKIKEANLLVDKIIVYKIMSARNLKHFYLTGDHNALKAVEEINTEISKLNKEYASKYQDIIIEN